MLKIYYNKLNLSKLLFYKKINQLNKILYLKKNINNRVIFWYCPISLPTEKFLSYY